MTMEGLYEKRTKKANRPGAVNFQGNLVDQGGTPERKEGKGAGSSSPLFYSGIRVEQRNDHYYE